MKKSILIIICILIFLPGCLYAVRYDGTYRGKVIDADTREPIEGVVVLGVWYKEHSTVAGAVHEFYDARETVTDKNGEFELSGMGLTTFVEPMHILIFKAGYEYIGTAPWGGLKKGFLLSKIVKWEGNKPIIPLKKLTMEERRKKLGPPSPPSEAPKEKIKLILKEINKDRAEQGLGLIDVGR
jgi:hypothetical protein